MKLKLTLDLPQSVNAIYGQNRKFNTRYLKKEGKEYKKKMVKYIREEVKKQDWIKLNAEQYCYIDQWVYMNSKGRDSDNLSKLLNDSITESEVVWLDDTYSLVRTQNVYIDAANPRVEMVISPVDFIGIFDTKEDYEIFKTKCEECKRFSNNCSIHKKVLENRIIPEVVIKDEIYCTKFNKK